MSGIKILGTGHFLPEFVVTNEDFTKIVDTSDEWIRTRTGIEKRHISLGQPAWYMGKQAAAKALEAAGISPDQVDMIVTTTVTPDYFWPSTSAIIQRELGIQNAFSMDLSVACSGVTYSLDMARRYLATGDVKTVLVVGTENLSQLNNYEDRGTCILFADGAGAMVVQGSGKPFASWLHTQIDNSHEVYCKRSRKPQPFEGQPDYEEILPFPIAWEEMTYMNGREVYKFATKAMPKAVTEACAKLGMTPADLDLIIPHQANLRIIETAVKNLGIGMDKVFVNIHEIANCSSATILIGMDQCVRSGRVKPGDKVCLVGFGGGLTIGANVFEY